MVIKPKRKRNQVAEVKIQMLQIISKDPNISYNELSRRLGINNHTAKKYRLEIDEALSRIRTEVKTELNERVEEKKGIWQKIAKTLGL